MNESKIRELCQAAAVRVGKNAGVAPQLCFPHIYLTFQQPLAELPEELPKRDTIDSPVFRNLLTDWWAKAASEDTDGTASALRVLVQHIDQAGPTIAAQLSGNSGWLPPGLTFRGYSDEDEQFGETILNYMRSRSEHGTDDLKMGDVIEVTAMWTQDQKWKVTCEGNPFEVVRISPEVPT